VLEQITEELSLLSAENKFLSKLNQRLTYHACRQEKYFIDWRRRSNLRNQSILSSQARESITGSAYTTLDENISREQVKRVVRDAEQALRQIQRPRLQTRLDEKAKVVQN